MMTTSQNGSMHLFGIFELDDAGTILYSRPHENVEQNGNHSKVGQNFFEAIGDSERADVLRRHVKNFMSSRRSVDSFIFEGFDQTSLRAKILITRGHETHDDTQAGIVIMDIKRHSF